MTEISTRREKFNQLKAAGAQNIQGSAQHTQVLGAAHVQDTYSST